MDLEWRIVVLVAGLLVGGVGWAVLQRVRGRLRPVRSASDLPSAFRDRAGTWRTLVQISTEVCTACRQSARVWREVAAEHPGVVFVEVDAADHMDLVRSLGIMTTPTTLVYDDAGALVGRLTGAPQRRAALAALAHEQDGALA